MSTIAIPDALPQLFVGKHKQGTGRACIMNAVAYMAGDKDITDMPDCVWPPFATIAQAINDHLCPHLTEIVTDELIVSKGLHHRVVHKLCDNCAHDVWMMGATLIGTAEAGHQLTRHDHARLLIRMAYRAMDWGIIVNVAKRHRDFWHLFNRIVPYAEKVVNGETPARRLDLNGDEGSTLDHMQEYGTLKAFAHFGRLVHLVSHDIATAGAFASAMYSTTTANYLVNDLGQRCGARRLLHYMPTFITWLHEAAGTPEPKAYTVTEAQVAKVPVMAG